MLVRIWIEHTTASGSVLSRPSAKASLACVQAVRKKVVSNLASSLAKAASELKKEGHSQGLPDAAAVARAVEQALQKHFGMPCLFQLPTRLSVCACVDLSLALTAFAVSAVQRSS